MQRAVLAVLLLNANEPVSRDHLVQAVWGPRATVNSPGLVATYVARLRRVLEPGRPRRSLDGVLASRGASYRLAVEPGRLDLQLFESARQRAREQRVAGDLADCAATLDEALARWRGGGLDGVPGPYAALHRGRLGELRLSAAEERFELALLLGRHHEVVAELGLLAAGHPYRERLRALLMLALYRAGRQGEALAVFAETRHLLVADLGLEPGRELEELHRRILRTDPGLELGGPGRESAGPLRTAWRPAQLPSDLADFTGRAAEVRTLLRILGPGPRPGARPGARPGSEPVAAARRTGAVPVAVVSGPPGAGKTVLAVHAAHLLREHFPDGQLYAALHGADGLPRPPAELLGRFLVDLGLEPAELPRELEQLAALFRSVSSGRRLLLVLDDAEDEAQLAPLLPGSPSCAVLVTARGRRAGRPGARAVLLGLLGPAEALRLLRRLLARTGAEANSADLPALDPAATQTVLAVCGGLPLALREAAARVLARPGCGLGPVAERLADERRALAELSPGGGGGRRVRDGRRAAAPGAGRPGGRAGAARARRAGSGRVRGGGGGRAVAAAAGAGRGAARSAGRVRSAAAGGGRTVRAAPARGALRAGRPARRPMDAGWNPDVTRRARRPAGPFLTCGDFPSQKVRGPPFA